MQFVTVGCVPVILRSTFAEDNFAIPAPQIMEKHRAGDPACAERRLPSVVEHIIKVFSEDRRVNSVLWSRSRRPSSDDEEGFG